MATTLLTGGAGYIGSHCYYALAEKGGSHELAVLDDYSTGKRSLLPEDAICHEGNVGDAETLDKVFAAHSIDTVIHFAGSVVVPESVKHPAKYYTNNTCNSVTLLEACVRHNVKSFMFSSTASVYGSGSGKPSKESDSTNPESPYASSKLMTERILQDFHHAYGINYVILRYFNVAGADSLLRCGQVSREATHLIRVACQAGLGIKECIPIYGVDYDTPDGTCIRDYIHVSDLAAAHELACELLKSKSGEPFGEVFNCGYGRGLSVLEVLDAFESATGIALNKPICGRRAGDPPLLVADPSKLTAFTGWKPDHKDLKGIVRSAFDWEKRFSRIRDADEGQST